MSTFVGQYVLQGGTTSVTMVPPTTQAGDRAIIWCNNKLEDKIPPTPSGWTLIGTAQVGTGAQGIDTGPIRKTFFEIDATGVLGSTVLTPAGGSINALGGGVVLRPGAGEYFLPSTMLSASDVTSNTTVACVMPSNQGFRVGDWLTQSVSLTHGSPGLPGRGVTVPGCTLVGHSGGSLGLNSTTQNTTGNHQYTYTECGQVTAGSQTAAATADGTTTTATTGGASHILTRTAKTATLGATLPAPVATVAAVRRVAAAALSLLGGVVATALGRRSTPATAAASLPAPVATAVGLRAGHGSGLAVLPGPVATALGGVQRAALGSATLPAPVGVMLGAVTGGGPTLDLWLVAEVEPDRYVCSVEPDRYAGTVEPDRYTGGVEA